jgi:hypothetical protein
MKANREACGATAPNRKNAVCEGRPEVGPSRRHRKAKDAPAGPRESQPNRKNAACEGRPEVGPSRRHGGSGGAKPPGLGVRGLSPGIQIYGASRSISHPSSFRRYLNLSCIRLTRPCQNSTTSGTTRYPPQKSGMGTSVPSGQRRSSSA